MVPVTLMSKDRAALLEIVLFAVNSIPGASPERLYQILYCADKLHMERTGSWLTDGEYHATSNGPVPTFVEGMIASLHGAHSLKCMLSRSVITSAMGFEPANGVVTCLRNANLDMLSVLEAECILDTVKFQACLNQRQISALCKDSAWYCSGRHKMISPREIIKTLPNANDLLSYVYG